MIKTAFITGVAGQDGSYLAEFLLGKGYEVHGLSRRFDLSKGIAANPHDPAPQMSAVYLHYGDLTDSTNISRLIREIGPDEVYNLGAQSRVAASFEAAEYTADVDGMGTLRILEAIRLAKLGNRSRFYQASTAELFGMAVQTPQRETTPFYPRSPYAVAKLYSYWITINYREAYGMFACNGMLFNHDSPRRGHEFVTRKITSGLANVSQGLQSRLEMGNLDARRDWGHAKDYVRMQWMMLQQPHPEDFVIATGEQHSVRDFLGWAAAELGITLEFSGHGVNEVGIATSVRGEAAAHVAAGDVLVSVNPQFFRPTDVVNLVGDPSKALKSLGWMPEISAREMCAEMVATDLKIAKRNAIGAQLAHAAK